MRGIKIPQQDFALKMPGGLMREGGGGGGGGGICGTLRYMQRYMQKYKRVFGKMLVICTA